MLEVKSERYLFFTNVVKRELSILAGPAERHRATAISSKGRISGNLKSKLFRGDSVATTIAVRSAGRAVPTNWTSWIEQAWIGGVRI